MEKRSRIFSLNNSKEEKPFQKKEIEEFFTYKNSKSKINFFFKFFVLSNNILIGVFKNEKNNPILNDFSKKKSITIFLKSTIKILVNLTFNFSFLIGLNSIVLKFQKILWKFSDVFNEFLLAKGHVFFKKENKFSKRKKNNPQKFLPQENLQYMRNFKKFSEKKKVLLNKDITQIKCFIINNLGKLTSILDLNINNQLEMIEQVSDHSINAYSNSIKIKNKINYVKNFKKNFNFCDRKTINLSIISFFICKFWD
jgi:hypothetical protein